MKTRSAALLLLLCVILLTCACGKANSPAVITVSPELPSEDEDKNSQDGDNSDKDEQGIELSPAPNPEGDEPPEEPVSDENKPPKPALEGEELKKVLSGLVERGCRLYDIVYGKGLAVDMSAESREGFWTYYPVLGEENLNSIDMLKNECRKLFSEDYCEYYLFDDMFGQFYSRFMEEDGVLYCTPYFGTDLREISWDISSAEYLLETEGMVYASVRCSYADLPEILPGLIILKNTENGWRLESDVSVSCLPEEKRRPEEITLEQAKAQFEKLGQEQTQLEKASGEYKLVFDPSIVEVSGKRCYEAFLFTVEGGRYADKGDILLAMDGGGVTRRVENELLFADYDAAVYHGYGDGCLAAVEYVGSTNDGQFGEIAAKYGEQFLLTVPVPVDCVGEDIFAVVPKYCGSKITVFPIYESGAVGEEIISAQDAVVIMACNVSDLWPNTLVRVEYLGQTVEFSPFISLKDGAVVTAQRVSLIPQRTPAEVTEIS